MLFILDLYGYQSEKTTQLWAYIGFEELSIEAENYIKRRDTSRMNGNGEYIIHGRNQLLEMCKKYEFFLYIDIKTKDQFLHEITELNKILTDRR